MSKWRLPEIFLDLDNNSSQEHVKRVKIDIELKNSSEIHDEIQSTQQSIADYKVHPRHLPELERELNDQIKFKVPEINAETQSPLSTKSKR